MDKVPAVGLRLTGNRWTVLRLWELQSGIKWLGRLGKALPGISQHSPANCLRNMRPNRLAEGTVYAKAPRTDDTLKGTGMRPVPAAMQAPDEDYEARHAVSEES